MIPLQTLDSLTMQTGKRSDKQPLLNKKRYTQPLASNFTQISEANGKGTHWKLCLSSISIVIAIIFITYTLVTNNDIKWLTKIMSSNSNSKNINKNIPKITSYLSENRINNINSDSGLSANAKSDLITYLPGLTVDINDLNYNMYSGYIEIDNTEDDNIDSDITKQLFYWFFEADMDNADEQPLFFWTNGGPGCSGMDGLMTEHGPLLINDDYELYQNDYSWNKHANIVYMEQPYGTGFSVPSKGQVVGGDNLASQDIDSFIRHFLLKYPKYWESEIYISSESWGGHYMPLTAWHILNNNADGKTPTINFKGILLGNPYTEYYENWIGMMESLYGHGLMKQTTYEVWRDECYGSLPDLTSAVCTLNYIQAYIQSISVDYYALDFPTCDITEKYGSKSEAMFNQKVARIHAKKVLELWDEFKTDKSFSSLISVKEEATIEENLSKIRGASASIAYYACSEDYMATYLNTETVQSALHAKKNTKWAMCSDDVYYAWPDNDWINGMQTVYHSILNDFSDSNIKILLYSGDDDSVCGTGGTQYWLRNMGWNVPIEEDWKEWRFNGQLAGYYTRFEMPSGRLALYLQTVRSAGHMVPTTQPKRALELMNRFLNSNDYQWE